MLGRVKDGTHSFFYHSKSMLVMIFNSSHQKFQTAFRISIIKIKISQFSYVDHREIHRINDCMFSTDGFRPRTDDHRPTASDYLQLTDDYQLPTTTKDYPPMTAVYRPTTIERQPQTIDQKLATSNQGMPTRDYRPQHHGPQRGYHGPPNGLSYASGGWLEVRCRPSTRDGRLTIRDQRPSSIDYRLISTRDHRPETID